MVEVAPDPGPPVALTEPPASDRAHLSYARSPYEPNCTKSPEKESGTFGSPYLQPLPILDFTLPGN